MFQNKFYETMGYWKFMHYKATESADLKKHIFYDFLLKYNSEVQLICDFQECSDGSTIMLLNEKLILIKIKKINV